ncbi:MAG: HAD family hydrolase [Candidatus Cloacimonetes bacterium]|nr:HAD family hydrolase [Candidatus Cloacimonadota bacterium]
MNKKTKAVFLDRDGTVNVDRNGYVRKTGEFELYPFSSEAVALLNRMDYLVFIVTNQSGIARGYYSVADLENIHRRMGELLAEQGARIDEIYYSPYHSEGHVEPFNISSDLRKPGLGMFQEALQKYDFNIPRSFMIGDKYSDIVFGRKAGLTTILVLTGDGSREFLEEREHWEYKPHFITDNLLAAAHLIERLRKSR